MNKIKVGVIGLGFIGILHIETLRRINGVEVVAISDVNENLLKHCCDEYGIQHAYTSPEDLIQDADVQVVHNCTPNHMHYEINMSTIRANKHIFSEKPLGLSTSESLEMLTLLHEHNNVVAGVNFCYRMNPLIIETRNRIQNGEIGQPFLVHGHYLQDWLLFDTDYNWRVEAAYAGESRCTADIGSHWLDLAQFLLDSKVVAVCADTMKAHEYRKKSSAAVETFSINQEGDYVEVPVTTEDYAGVLLKFENGTTGIFHCSQISAGRKCCIEVEVDGALASFSWNHEYSDHMWKGNRNGNNEDIMRNPNFFTAQAKAYTSLPAGHPEGWNDAFKNNLFAYYQRIGNHSIGSDDSYDFATFEDGHYISKIVEAIVSSSQQKRWIYLS